MVDSEKKPEIRSPSIKVLSEWVTDWVISNNPADSSTVSWADIEALTGLKKDEKDMMFTLMSAKRTLYSTTRFEFKITDEGLYFLSPAGRKNELYRRHRESISRHRAIISSSATIPVEKLTNQEKAEVQHAQRMALHLYETAKKELRKKWMSSAAEDLKKIEETKP